MEKGVSLILTIIILIVVLVIVFGLSGILISQIKTIREMGNSVIAFYSADTGMERTLKSVMDYIKDDTNPPPEDSYLDSDIGNGAGYQVEVVCCVYHPTQNPNCFFDGVSCNISDNGDGINDGESYSDGNCKASFYCLRSVGKYKNAKRAIEVEVFPVD